MSKVSDYVITLTDVNGFTIDSTNYKIAEGFPVSLNVVSFTKAYKNKIDPRSQPNKLISLVSGVATKFSDRKGEINYSGLENPAITLSGLIQIGAENGFVAGSTKIKVINLQLLHDFATIPNVYYLKDYYGSDNPKLPIEGLINYDDFFTKWQATPSKVYTSKGMPVVITSCTISKPYTTEKGLVVDFNMNLVEAKE